MSWSISMIGTPAGVVDGLKRNSDLLCGQSREEYDAAKPHLIGLVEQVVGQKVKLNACGSAAFHDGVKKHGSCSVSLDAFYGDFLGDPATAEKA